MRNFQDTFESCKRSFISAFLLCMTLPLIEIIFSERFPHPDKDLWGISCEYLPGPPEPTEEEIIRLCLCHTIFINFLS